MEVAGKEGMSECGEVQNENGHLQSKQSSASNDCDENQNGNTSSPSDSQQQLVPQLAHLGITQHDLSICIKVLDAISTLDPKRHKKRKATNDDDNNNALQEHDGLTQFRQPNLRPFRKSLSSCLSLHQQLQYNGQSEEEYYTRRLEERTLKRQKMAERAQQKKYVAATDLRRGRVERLERLKMEGREEEEERRRGLLEYLVPDGHVVDAADLVAGSHAGAVLLENGHDAATNHATESSSSVAEASLEKNNTDPSSSPKVLPNLRSCYTCKIRFRTLHHFYDQLCETCAPLNYTKRHQTADMSGKVAIVTGSRIKIGYQVVLKLLRAGCHVVATTRFPNCAVEQYRREADFRVWKDRLQVYGLDLRDVTGLEAFTRYLKCRFGEGGIDVLINNACQTVRRPGGYYMPLVEREGVLWREGDDDHRKILGGCLEFERIRRRLVAEQHGHNVEGEGVGVKLLPNASAKPELPGVGHGVTQDNALLDAVTLPDSSQMVTKSAQASTATNDNIPFEATGISHSAAMSQMAILPEDVGIDENVLPAGLSDINGQQLDLRQTNSWLLKMDQVSTPEIMECMFVNAIAPFVLNSRLKPLMEAPKNDPNRSDRYIINVSAMEGKFYRYKMPNHPHTNMAKAALNMLTRTSAEDLATKSRIFMNSVDTGWINDENPLEKASKIAKTNLFQTPIDEVDAAARILDPVFVGVNADKEASGEERGMKDYGKFFKDYKETEW
ncbi:hypothetical protein HJC23_003343 [Cyclotella cryptica]|uniref:Oxidoreductase n=1 Tax=Cyclotella cryptica TaxID=29204 RepID=A0ABD3QXZ4_9STRA